MMPSCLTLTPQRRVSVARFLLPVFSLLILAALLAIASPIRAQQPAPAQKPARHPMPAETSSDAQLQAFERNFAEAFRARDVNKIMSFYALGKELFVFDLVPPRQYAGWDAYKRDWESLLAAYPGPVKVKMIDVVTHAVGAVGYGHSIQDITFTDKDGKETRSVVRVTDVYRRMGGPAGKWKIVQEHVSVPVDLATGKPDMLSKP